VWLSIALRRKNQQKDADFALNQALQLNPQSAFAKQTAQGK
jgi:Flp pilus assembly protein TadD